MTAATPATSSTDERRAVLRGLEAWLELPMMVLGLVWLALFVVDVAGWTLPGAATAMTAIWAIFVADFALRLWVADDRVAYLKGSWLTAIALALPALRILRFARAVRALRAARAVRGLRAARLVTSLSRARRSVHGLLGRRHGVGYAAVLTALVVAAGAAAMLAAEQDGPRAFDGYGHALWWTAMLVTTMGSDIWPATAEGRAITLAISIYGFAVFGYLTATIASWFVGKERAARASS